MSTENKVENLAQNAKGHVKEGVGAATGNEELKREGRGDQAVAEGKQKLEQVKDSVSDVAEKAKDKIKQGIGAVTGKDKDTPDHESH